MRRARTRDPRPKRRFEGTIGGNNLDGAARRLRAPGSQQANAEELLAELLRLVDSSGPAPGRSRAPAGPVSERTRTSAEPMSKPGETGAIYVEPLTAPAKIGSDCGRFYETVIE
jgi:hypothetical protein